MYLALYLDKDIGALRTCIWPFIYKNNSSLNGNNNVFWPSILIPWRDFKLILGRLFPLPLFPSTLHEMSQLVDAQVNDWEKWYPYTSKKNLPKSIKWFFI
jgi:hypothetical protein